MRKTTRKTPKKYVDSKAAQKRRAPAAIKGFKFRGIF
jgi:hypothetical protein